MKTRLLQFQQEQTLISLSRREFSEEYINGYVIDYSDELIAMAEFNNLGEYDGLTVIWLDHVTDIVWNSVDLQSIHSLIHQQSKEQRSLSYPVQAVPNLELEFLPELIKSISMGFRSLAIYKENMSMGGQFGQLASINDEWLEMLEFSPKDRMNRYNSLIRVYDITKVRTDSQYLRSLEALYLK